MVEVKYSKITLNAGFTFTLAFRIFSGYIFHRNGKSTRIPCLHGLSQSEVSSSFFAEFHSSIKKLPWVST